jgi:ATP-dependent Clp protease ATP-binding subunit ClpB
VDLQMELLKRRLADRKIGVVITDKAKALLADKGYDPIYGARPLKRTIQQEIQNPLAMKILAGEIREGQTARIDADKAGAFTFTAA